MGQEILSCVEDSNDLCVYKKSETDEIFESRPECIIDFSLPEALRYSCEKALFFQCPLIVGTTGLLDSHKNLLTKYSQSIPVFYSTNYSLGIHCVHSMLNSIKNQLDGWDIGMIETHHTEKKDSPSGTAISLKATLEKDFHINSLRLKGVPGEHEIIFSNESEIIHLRHTAYSRQVFAKGALDCARWILDNNFINGFYTMDSRFKG
ncbi:MAG: 4-hydroxy-tetrahydrodipicolinate reductase [Caldisericia bacterium]|nr:4-hydroxy-tetrahydrodipicolinate reductase [Caldisericia bacterium]